VLAWVAVLLSLLVPTVARADSSLVFSAADLTTLGLHPTPASSESARAQLVAGLPSSVLAPVGEALTEASAGRTRGRRLRSAAFVLRSARSAGLVLARWGRAHHAGRVRVGAGGAAFMLRSRKRAVVEVLWRDGSRLGFVVLGATRKLGKARAAALAYAVLADSYLKTPLPTTAWEQVLAQTRPNGTLSKSTALQAFALAYGPLPGVHPPRGPIGQIPDGTLAAQWVLSYRSQLSRGQLRVVDRLLGVPAPGVPGNDVRARAASFGDPGFSPNLAIQAMAEKWAGIEGGKLGHALGLTIVAGTTTTIVKTTTSGLVTADAQAFNIDEGWGSGKAEFCRIRVPPSGQATEKADPVFFNLVMAHEVFHCFQFDLRGALVWTPLPDWIIEGMADWAALTVDPVAYSVGGGNLTTYFKFPHTPLFLRSYDSVGFWGHVQDTFGDLWSRIPAILTAPGGSPGAFDAAEGADTTKFLSTWGSSVFNRPVGGPPWEMISPIVPPGTAGPPVGMIDGTGSVEAAPYTTAQYSYTDSDPRTPIVYVSIKGSARLSTQHNYTDLGAALFCTTARCVCPPRTSGYVPPTRPLSVPTRLGLSGNPGGGTEGSLEAVSLSAFCRPKKPPPGGNAASGGDPELFDFDGGVFGFQAAGEFTLLKSTQDDLQVQVRQQPFPGSRYVAENTAVAMRVGSAIVEVDAAGKSALAVYVDRHPLNAPADGVTRVRLGGGRLIVSGASALVDWPDGSSVDVFNWLADANGQGVETPQGDKLVPALNLVIRLAPHRRRHVAGLLGNWGEPASREFVGRNGRAYPQSVITAGDVDEATPGELRVIYHEFGAGWRITQRESLFRYPPHKNTNSYTIRGFPRRYLTVKSLPLQQQGAGWTVCKAAGITNAQVFDGCEFDVGATGDKGFAIGDHKLQTAAGLPVSSTGLPGRPTGVPGPPSKLHAIDLGTGNDVTQPEVAYDPGSKDTYVAWVDSSDSSIDLCVVGAGASACNAGAGPYKLIDPLASSSGSTPLYSDSQIVIQPGGEVVVLAEVDGANGAAYPPGYGAEGDVAWSSAAGGAAFASSTQGIANGGGILAPSPGDAPSAGAIALSASDIGVYGEGAIVNGFTDFTLSAAAPSAAPVVDSTGRYQDTLGITGNQLASVPDPAAAGQYIVVAVGGGFGSGCPSGSNSVTGYGVAVGTPASLQEQSAWSSKYFAPISCEAGDPVLAGGGPTGGTIGLLEEEGPDLTSANTGSQGVFYRRFDTGTDTFGAPVLVSNETSLSGAGDLDVAQDHSGDVYASWSDSRGTVLDYSSTAGASWRKPVAITLPISPNDDIVVAGAGGGAAEFAYTAPHGGGVQVYLVGVAYP
jgi:hypothetical protein